MATARSPMRTPSQTPAVVAESEMLRAIQLELEQLREERRIEREQMLQLREELQQKDETLHRMERNFTQLSRSNNISVSAGDSRLIPSRSELIAEDLGYKLKPDFYDGSVPIREFFSQFELIAKANNWSDSTKSIALAACLRGKARMILDSFEDVEHLQYCDLKNKLELRFGERHLGQNYYSQFTNRKQKNDEDFVTLGAELERLARLAYPECNFEVRDRIACAQFIAALTDKFLKRTMQLEGINSLRIAIERVSAIRVIQENSFSRNFEKFNEDKNKNYSSDSEDINKERKNLN